ncbi:uncharacterized protein LOC130939646 [Arachis stenosperma]|uniref:uncharacterized protein LOC130939646 n=1 Tax=Arachis stenosperma TaxID=217475 RepID=UPI0025AB8045|nr:uncharacterized protein LOC130939646 [Arachis stenosperma]
MADHESRFERLARQVERIARIVDYDEGERHNARENNEGMENIFQNKNHIPNQKNPHTVLRHENADDVLNGLRSDRYQVTRIVEDVLNRVRLNVGFMDQPHFVSAFLQVVQMAEVSRGVKNQKITIKFAGEVGKSTTKHVARYLVEIENLVNDENLKIKFFSSSLTKNAFTWFSNLRPNSITTWNQLKTAFHAQFYRGEMNVAVTGLVALKCENGEIIDDYLIRFKNARSRCYVTLPESEIVKIATMCEKSNDSKLKSGKKYSFDISKSDQIFDVLLKDKQLVLSEGRTLLSIKDLKGKPYCKFHQATSHSTNNCVRFRDLIQKAIMEGRLKFDDGKKEMKVDVNPFEIDASYVEPCFGVNTVGKSYDFDVALDDFES